MLDVSTSLAPRISAEFESRSLHQIQGNYMRHCTTCHKDYEDYGQRRSICRPCKRIYDREYHARRSPEARQRKLSLQADRVVEARQFIWDYLKDHPCVSCGESDPVVLEFDHIDRSEKFMAVAELATYSLETISKEIAKCRVLCANCHRRHTAVQLGWYKDLTR